jgi:hypothetical protein
MTETIKNYAIFFLFQNVSIVIESEFNSNFMIDFYWKFNVFFKKVYLKKSQKSGFFYIDF